MSDEAADGVEAWRRTWSLGNYPVVGDLWASVGRGVIRELDARIGLAGRALVDVACGHGTTALAAAAVGADVTAVDLTPTLLEETRRRAAAAGLTLDVVEADFHDLPLPDGAGEVATSTFGVFLAQDPQTAAAELARITRPGGVVAVTAWTAAAGFRDRVEAIAELTGDTVEEQLAGRPDIWAWATVGGLERITATTDLTVEDVSTTEVLLPVASVEDLLRTFTEHSGPSLETKAMLRERGIAWEQLLDILRPRWEARMRPEGFPLPYARALLRR